LSTSSFIPIDSILNGFNK